MTLFATLHSKPLQLSRTQSRWSRWMARKLFPEMVGIQWPARSSHDLAKLVKITRSTMANYKFFGQIHNSFWFYGQNQKYDSHDSIRWPWWVSAAWLGKRFSFQYMFYMLLGMRKYTLSIITISTIIIIIVWYIQCLHLFYAGTWSSSIQFCRVWTRHLDCLSIPGWNPQIPDIHTLSIIPMLVFPLRYQVLFHHFSPFQWPP